MSAGDTWCLRPGQALQYRQWDDGQGDDEYVLYNDLSGDTHLLGGPAIEILLALARGPATRAALVALLQAEFDIDPDEVRFETGELLQLLQRLWLIAPSAC
ncbi:HPr-rel-A system PqqD family peptide chaperone [uncultured Massilia sp.]|uniref:HPr-rel-A system PqqD family peptide chaperone n=1 Tax=uncultured Massilia sp. TaxID=169973 RepID=UPI0025E262D3|nr:HPr-rel-A system PqqD family peptide chaperone [uncultured Massilia sp.]